MLKSPVLVAHQPEYFPWLGFIAKAQLADVYYIVDTVQYMKEHWHSRNKIRSMQTRTSRWLGGISRNCTY